MPKTKCLHSWRPIDACNLSSAGPINLPVRVADQGPSGHLSLASLLGGPKHSPHLLYAVMRLRRGSAALLRGHLRRITLQFTVRLWHATSALASACQVYRKP